MWECEEEIWTARTGDKRDLIVGDADSQCFPENQGPLNCLQLGNLIWRKLKSFITFDSVVLSNLLMEIQNPLQYAGTELSSSERAASFLTTAYLSSLP